MQRAIIYSVVLVLFGLTGARILSYGAIPGPNSFMQHNREPQAPPLYLNASNVSTFKDHSSVPNDITTFDTTDSLDDVLCFYQRELAWIGWQKATANDWRPRPTRIVAANHAPPECAQSYYYFYFVAPPDWCFSGARTGFHITYRADSDVLHIRTEWTHEGNGMR